MMQPLKPTTTFGAPPDPYNNAYVHYYSQFPSQNPNPPPYHHHLQIHPPHFTDPQPPGVLDPLLPSYSINPSPLPPYHHPPPPPPAAADFTFSHEPPLPTYLTQNWASTEYGNTLYPLGASVSQDVSQQLLPVIPTHSTWTNPKPTIQSWKKIPKKTKIAQSAWCEICKIACNTGDVLYKHKLGRKHIKNVEKLMSAYSGASTTSNPVIGPSEKPKGNSGTKKKAETLQDLENKRMKVLQGGAAANAVRTCTLCNVVCNSDTVFRFHLAGQKHASMLKQLQQPAGV